jgi:cytochrome P450
VDETHDGPAPKPDGLTSIEEDLWTDELLVDPYDAYRRIRDAGPVVWLERPGVVALPRFAEVRAALADWRHFSSAHGVALNDVANELMGPTIVTTDPPLHDHIRRPMASQLSTAALAPDIELVEAIASRFVDQVVERATFDGVADLARPYSLTVVGDLVGLPQEGREAYPGLAERAFNIMGPANERVADGVAALTELRTRTAASCPHLTPERRGQELVDLGVADSLVSYTWPGIDTTVNAIGSGLALFADRPDQWDLIRTDPDLIPAAFNEIVRLHSPVHYFSRMVMADVVLGGVEIQAGTRVLMMYGSANRDERRFDDPDRFDVTRNEGGQLAFGRGIHLCVGINLARLEAHSLLAALVERVERFEPAGEREWTVNNTLHGLHRLPIRAVPA